MANLKPNSGYKDNFNQNRFCYPPCETVEFRYTGKRIWYTKCNGSIPIPPSYYI